jgi:hypothetical protein
MSCAGRYSTLPASVGGDAALGAHQQMLAHSPSSVAELLAQGRLAHVQTRRLRQAADVDDLHEVLQAPGFIRNSGGWRRGTNGRIHSVLSRQTELVLASGAARLYR